MRFVFYFLFFILTLYGCAVKQALTGGDIDKTPPKIVSVSPADSSLSISPSVIKIQFDEYVQLKSPEKNVFVSPLLKYPLEFVNKGKSIVIKIKDTLETNTTYTFYFQEAIADNNEGVVLDQYKYTFSTGKFMDTNYIKGKILPAESSIPPKTIVAFYPIQTLDSNMLTNKPLYIVPVDAQGNFMASNIKAQDYKVLVLQDNNQNTLYDKYQEQVGYGKWINNKWESPLYLYTEVPMKQGLKRHTFSLPGKLALKTYLPIKDLQVTILPPFASTATHTLQTISPDSVAIWLPYLAGNKVEVELRANGITLDTLKLDYSADKNKFKNKVDTNCSIRYIIDDIPSIQINQPISYYKKNAILILQGKDTIPIKRLRYYEDDPTKLGIEADYKPTKKYTIMIPPSTIYTIYNYTNKDSLKITYTADPIPTGKLDLQLVVDSASQNHTFHLQILKDKLLLLEEQLYADKTLKIPLPEGNYQLLVWEDENNNCVKDNGSLFPYTKPERLFTYTSIVTIKKNWDNKIKWQLYNTKFK